MSQEDEHLGLKNLAKFAIPRSIKSQSAHAISEFSYKSNIVCLFITINA